ncbi:MAG: tetratricopeptide repeat protein [Saprospiraceae bacterium]|nr:tetratricopeptide repeat protein [Saprospiraceae bacterium]MCB9343063.1 tetratricopeptide repeat protein [Lewinellaceae bacterium]
MNLQQPQPLKLIFRGRLDFGSQRTYDLVLKHWHSRIENYFKTEVLFTAEELFTEEDFSLTVPQQTLMSTAKHWRNTTSLLKEVAQYALAGNVGAWWVQNGQVLDEYQIEPETEKAAVSEFLRGRELVKEGGMEQASVALSNAIEKFARHAAAYERRGYVNYKLKNYNDALHDFSKSISINPKSPEPYYGRGKVLMLKNEWESAIPDFDKTIKGALAVQPIYWLARLRKSECLFHAKRFSEAIPELKLYLQRKFYDNDPNLRFISKAEYLLNECEKMIN